MLHHLFTLVITTALAVSIFPGTVQASALKWDQTKVKVELKPGEEATTAEFVATNVSKKTVYIDRIKTSCGCTGSILDKKEIKPGASATIVGTFRKGSRQGLNHNRLEVYLKGQPKAVETLHMLVQVPNLVDAEPSIVFWNRSSSKTERQVSIKLDKHYVDTIDTIKYDPELLTIRKEATADKATECVLYILPKSFDQQLRHSVTIEAKGSNDMAAETTIQVFVQP